MSEANEVLLIAYLVLLGLIAALTCATDIAFRLLAHWQARRKARKDQYPWIDKLVVRK